MNRIAITCLLLAAAPAWSQEKPAWPTVPSVEAQPLLAQARRVAQALDFLGQPLSAEAKKTLDDLKVGDGDEKVAAAIQRIFDPLCVAAVEIGKEGATKATASAGKVDLIEQGWRLALIKVINKGGSTGTLRVDSPNNRPVPTGPKDEIATRWLGLAPWTGQPLLPTLGGLELEYVAIQMYTRDAGEKTGALTFRVEGPAGKPGPVVKDWRFDKDEAGWKAVNQAKVSSEKSKLVVEATGANPQIASDVTGPAGGYILRFWAAFEKAGRVAVNFKVKGQNDYQARPVANVAIEPGRGVEYTLRFRSMAELESVRLDLGSEGKIVFDWVILNRDDAGGQTVSTAFHIEGKPCTEVSFRVMEEDGTQTTAGFTIRDAQGRVFPLQSKRLAPDFFFHPQIYRSTGETVRLPAGKYTVLCKRGPESIPEEKTLLVGAEPITLVYQVKRWTDPAKRSWYSGDHHIHAAGCQHYENPTEGVHPPDMMRHILGEDLKVGCCLTWGPCFDYQKRFFTGKPDDVSRPPYLLRYDVEVSGFGSHQSGHLCLLDLKEQIPAGGLSKNHWPTLGMNTLRWAKKQGAVTGPAHSATGLTRFVGRVEGGKDGANGLPTYQIPAYDSIGANEFIVQAAVPVPGADGKPTSAVDFISTMDTDRKTELNMWYHTLNCGFQVKASGESDFPCIYGERVGVGRVYVKVDGPITWEKWVRGIADGRSYVSDGTTHLMDYTAEASGKKYELGVAGSEIKLEKPGKVKLTVQAAARLTGSPKVQAELIVNGYPVATQELVANGKEQELTFEADLAKSSWVAVRIFPHAHTNPFFVLVEGKPIRASKASAEWCLRGVDQCWTSKKPTYKAEELKQAEADYEAARQVYKKIKEECAE
jgi:hypothetical protein